MSRMFQHYPDVVTVEQLCKMLCIGRNSAYKLLQTGEVKSVRIGKKYVIPTRWVVDYLEQHQSK